jgi:hypothetical protein
MKLCKNLGGSRIAKRKLDHNIFKYTINCMISSLVYDKSCQHSINFLVRDLFKNYCALFLSIQLIA